MNTHIRRLFAVAIYIALISTAFSAQEAEAQNGHLSELVHIADSLYQIALNVPAIEQGDYLLNYRIHVDSLREQHLQLNREVMGQAERSVGSQGGPITLMNNKEFNNLSRANKVAADHYFASLVVLHKLWTKRHGTTGRSILREEDAILISNSVKTIERIQDQYQGKWIPYEQSKFKDSPTMTKERYEEMMEETVNVLRSSEHFYETTERLEAERKLLSVLL
ncbi:MAG: hypothetical protein KTR29_02015 [Rhodothermaceae bacterium]|nr:hypothetical protein [Rhodothermaceae bacterium]